MDGDDGRGDEGEDGVGKVMHMVSVGGWYFKVRAQWAGLEPTCVRDLSCISG